GRPGRRLKSAIEGGKTDSLTADLSFRNEEDYRYLVENANSIIMKADNEGYITFMNSYGLKFFGYSEEEIIGRHVIGTTIPLTDSSGRDLIGFAKAIIGNPEGFLVNEHENMRKDGSLVWVSWTNRAIRDKEGNLIGTLAIGNDISAFKQIEKAYIESEKKYRRIVETTAEGVVTSNQVNRFVYVNRKMAEMLGYSVDEILGKTIADFMFDSNGDKEQLLREKSKTGDVSGEIKFRRRDGSELWTSFNASPLIGEHGERIGNFAMYTDITDRKKWEDDLYRSEERFRIAFEDGAIPMVLTSLGGEFIKVNHAFCDLTGYSEKELIGMNFNKMTHPDDLKANIDGFKQVLDGKRKSFRMEKRYLRKNGEVVWADMSTAPVRDKNGDPQYMVTHVQDINERKQAENELENSHEKLEIALESGHIGIWDLNLKTSEMTFDKRMGMIINLAPGTYSLNDPVLKNMIHEDDLVHVKEALGASTKNGTLFESIFRTKAADAGYKYVSTKALIKYDNARNPASLTGVCFDITSMKKGAEKDLIRLNEELIRSNKELESFAYVASHDLQEPLRMISSYTQMLELRYADKLDENARDYIKFAVDGSKRMYDLINGMLEYSRINTRGQQFSRVNMSDVFEKVVNNLKLSIREQKAVVTKGPLPVVTADEMQMVQLLQNLIENALKFSKGNPRIHISSGTGKKQYQFAVKDEGIGIDPQYFDRIFKLYQQLMPRDKYKGIGIGLPICKRIVERHGGEIWVESKPGKGSTFLFTIPKR
ncbi:MAG: PAS domain S-box protein, partial [Bacteroidales bacterium]